MRKPYLSLSLTFIVALLGLGLFVLGAAAEDLTQRCKGRFANKGAKVFNFSPLGMRIRSLVHLREAEE